MEPRIIPRKKHCISRKQVSPNALRTLYRLHNKGFVAYLVGGCVRDLLMGRTPKDFDIATNATPSQIRRLFRNCRLIGRRFRLAHLHFQGEILEVSTFRGAAPHFDNADMEEADHAKRVFRRIKDKNGMVLRDNVFGTPEEDALCRDFTINALAYNIADFSVIDYSTGLSDLQQRLIRPIGDPYVRFTEDPVRMLRAVRFSASHNLVIEPVTWEILCRLSSTISRVPPARLYEEIQKLFLLGYAGPNFSLLDTSGLLAALFPGLNRWMYQNNDRPALLQRNLEYLDQRYQNGTPPSPALFLAALFGPSLEEMAMAYHRDGIPHVQAPDVTYTAFMKEICTTASVPGRVGKQLFAILALQPSLCRIPPRHPSSIVTKPEFADALAYFRLEAGTRKKDRTSPEWWDAFLVESPSVTLSEPAADQARPAKRRRKRRRRHHRTAQTAA
ncbi:polynucleotide adenylyltransferase PcnB [Syntrophorhabdus aromaticivorans]|uniref:Poly(A) polymerase I n=1 Tax=Syntrophorhabdus aromaticivorans TaxID=328301 RepID=A0A351U291_9BACT|nr:polynucleotide adenylyltransferase PcnB [Syntrophorhabdus aromaticivorans]NLW36617.1 polynucleotide adenylyltransferase PcnB [Syntrophorhabdus aromaticivorans]HBA54072.1 polynucleotide adenylyltransferase PcnB [Syntrophorhabdus aromaticivorans]